jgi:hypothetical protein
MCSLSTPSDSINTLHTSITMGITKKRKEKEFNEIILSKP